MQNIILSPPQAELLDEMPEPYTVVRTARLLEQLTGEKNVLLPTGCVLRRGSMSCKLGGYAADGRDVNRVLTDITLWGAIKRAFPVSEWKSAFSALRS